MVLPALSPCRAKLGMRRGTACSSKPAGEGTHGRTAQMEQISLIQWTTSSYKNNSWVTLTWANWGFNTLGGAGTGTDDLLGKIHHQTSWKSGSALFLPHGEPALHRDWRGTKVGKSQPVTRDSAWLVATGARTIKGPQESWHGMTLKKQAIAQQGLQTIK